MHAFLKIPKLLFFLSILFLAPALQAQQRISGPYTHENLSLFLIHDTQAAASTTTFLTLEEAMAQKKVVVNETSNVNELTIENLSAEEIYVQSGDIVKGGRQDRVISLDFILRPKSGKIPVAAFCVEHGRWQARGVEDVTKFSTSSNQLVTKDLKIAAKKDRDQSAVWAGVSKAQGELSRNVAADVAAPESKTSLELSLNAPKVVQSADAYLKALASITDKNSDVIGFAFAINGKLNSGDIYLSSTLFKKLWPKLLKASAIEAISQLNGPKNPTQPTQQDVKNFFESAQKGTVQTQEVTKTLQMKTYETASYYLFETIDLEKYGWIHRNYIVK